MERNLIDQLKTIKPFVYLASPYSKYPWGIEEAFTEVCEAAGWLLKRGVAVFCPIAHSHPIAEYGNIDPCDHTIWMPADEPLMDAAGGLCVLMMQSWEESVGVRAEIERFTQQGKPVFYMPWPVEEE